MPETNAPILRVSGDTGCAVGGPSCLTCTFSEDMCVFDLPTQEQKAVWSSRKRQSTKARETVAKVIPLVQAGMTDQQAAAEANVSRRTVQRARLRSGLAREKGGPEPKTMLALSYFMGATPVREAADALGIPYRTVRRYYQLLREGKQ